MQDMQSTDFTDSQSELFDMPLDMNQPDPTYVQVIGLYTSLQNYQDTDD
jgi:hypothetical protein